MAEDWLGVNDLPPGPKITQLTKKKGTYIRASDLGVFSHPQPDGDTYIFVPEATPEEEESGGFPSEHHQTEGNQ